MSFALFAQWLQVLQSFRCAGNFTLLQWIHCQVNLCGDQPWYVTGDHHKGLWFWILTASWYQLPWTTAPHCEIYLFSPEFLCVTTADRLSAALNTECVREPLPSENGGVWGNICRKETHVMPVSTAFCFYSQAKVCLSAWYPTLVHVKRLCWGWSFPQQKTKNTESKWSWLFSCGRACKSFKNRCGLDPINI